MLIKKNPITCLVLCNILSHFSIHSAYTGIHYWLYINGCDLIHLINTEHILLHTFTHIYWPVYIKYLTFYALNVM